MRKFLAGIWRGIKAVQSFIGTVIFFVILFTVLALLMRDDQPGVPKDAALVLNLEGNIVEQRTEREAVEVLSEEFGEPARQEILLRDVIEAIDLAQDDDRIKALVLSLDKLGGGGPSKLHRIGQALEAFGESGKPIVAVGDGYTQNQYLLAAHADTILMHPYGFVFLEGYGRFRFYYKALLDKLKVSVNVFKVGTFKSAVEPFLRDDMSPAARQANEAFLGVLWDNYLDDAETARGLEDGAIAAYVENFPEVLRDAGGNTAKAALDAGLVDELRTRVEQRDYLVDLVGEDGKERAFRGIGYRRYLRAVRDFEPADEDKIAIIVAAGLIVEGEAPRGLIGGDTVARLIRRARDDNDVKAIVLRVDSGGGSAFASEIIRNELVAAKEAGKPVVASMGSVAASGGYWIAASADQIWAAPTTITGSIGIFGIFPTFETSLDTIGIHSDGIGTTRLSGAANPARKILPEVADALQLVIEDGYRRFITLVAEARGKTPEEVDEIGQGRVWSGETAHRIGLVDHLGTLEDAVEAAAGLAGLEEYEIEYVEKPPSFTQQLLSQLLNDGRAALGLGRPKVSSPIAGALARIISDIRLLANLNDPGGAYALCLACAALRN